MTIEEQVAGLVTSLETLTNKVDNITTNMVKKDEQIDQLMENQKNQNSYITKLEQLSKQPAGTGKPVTNKAYETYVVNSWKTNVINEGLDLAAQSYDKSHVDSMAQEVNDYCLKNMQDNNVTTDYVISVFQLLYGRAMGNPDHTIHQLRKNPGVVTPVRQPAPVQPNPLHESLTPPTLRGNTPSVGNVPPIVQSKSIKESYQGLEARLNNAKDDL